MTHFYVSKDKMNKINKIQDEHKCWQNKTGSLWSYIFTPTEIGIEVVIRCNRCKQIWNIEEDYDDE